MIVPTSKIPDHLDNALRQLTAIRDELCRQGKRKHRATLLINARVRELVPGVASTPARFAMLVKREGIENASAMLRKGI